MEGFIIGFDEVEGPASGPEEPALALPLPVEDVLNPLAIRLKFEKRETSYSTFGHNWLFIFTKYF